MRSTLQKTAAMMLVLSLFGGATSTIVSAQGSQPAPTPSVPGITVTPGFQPRRPAPQPLVPDARGGAARQNPNDSETPRANPHGGCQYEAQPLELIV